VDKDTNSRENNDREKGMGREEGGWKKGERRVRE